MKHFVLTLFVLCVLPHASQAIDELTAKQIAEDAAGCTKAKLCETRARLEDDRWVLIVSTIFGHRDTGEPIFKPGGWTGFTIDQDGNIVDRTPGR